MAHARLEALITVPDGGWSFTVNDGGGPDAVTFAEGDTYYPSSLLTTLKSKMDTATGKVFTVTGAFGSSGTGKVTISVSSGTYAIDWTGATVLRDVLGWTGNIAATATATSTNGMMGVWLPDCAISSAGDIDFDSVGHLRTDAAFSVSPTGVVTFWHGTDQQSFRSITWPLVSRSRAIDVASSLLSWQEFVRDSLLGGVSAFAASITPPTVTFYYDADNNYVVGQDAPLPAGDGVYYLVVSPDLGLPRAAEGYTLLYTVQILEAFKA